MGEAYSIRVRGFSGCAVLLLALFRAAYYATKHPCACPYDLARNGSRCGGRSAYSRPGGASLGIKPLSEFCARQKGIMRILNGMLEGNPEDAAILRRWGAMASKVAAIARSAR